MTIIPTLKDKIDFICLEDGSYYNREDLLNIQSYIHAHYAIRMSLSDCKKFWLWRSDCCGASFLTVEDKKEVIEFFDKWIKESFDAGSFYDKMEIRKEW